MVVNGRITRRGALGLAAASTLAIGHRAVAQTSPIRIGWVVSLTGVFTASALAGDFAIRKAVIELNGKGGLLGRQIELITRDSTSDVQRSLNYVREMCYSVNADVIIGPSNSGEGLPAVPLTTAAHKIHMIYGAVQELIDPVKYPYAFRANLTAEQTAEVANNYAIDVAKKKRIAVIADSTGFGTLQSGSAIKHLKARGVPPIYVRLVDPNKVDLTDEIAQAREAGADVVMPWSNAFGLLARIVNARGDQKWDVPIMGMPNLLTDQVAELLSVPAYRENVLAPYFAACALDEAGHLPSATEDYLKRYAGEVEPFLKYGLQNILQGHAAVYLYAEGAKRAGSTASDDVKKAMEGITDLQLPFGKFTYSPTEHNGFTPDSLLMMVASSGKPNGGFRPAPRA